MKLIIAEDLNNRDGEKKYHQPKPSFPPKIIEYLHVEIQKIDELTRE